MLYTYGRNSWQGSSKLPASCKLQGSHAIHRTGGVNRGHGQEKEVLFWFISCRPAQRRNTWEQWIMFNELHWLLVWRGPLACLMCSFKLTAQHSTTKFADSSFQYHTKETYYFPPPRILVPYLAEHFITLSSSDKSGPWERRGWFFFSLTHHSRNSSSKLPLPLS